MQLAVLVQTSADVSAVSARSAKIAALAGLLNALEPAEVALAVKYLSGDLPQGRLGVGYRTLMDLNTPAAAAASLSLLELDARLTELSAAKGAGVTARRAAQLGALFSRATAAEQSFLRRLLVGELRQGALEGVMLEAIAAAFRVRPEPLRRAAMLAGDLSRVAEAAQRDGEAGLARYALELFRPLAPMLAQSAAGVGEALESLGPAQLEYKLDGVRVQVHKEQDQVRVYTRALHEVTARVPELANAVRALPARSLILDGEVLSVKGDGRPQPFQVTMRRFGKKLEDEALRRELPLSPFFFDLLHADGQDLIDRPQSARSEALCALVPEAQRIPSRLIADPDEAESFFSASLAAGHEGLMAKATSAPYEAGRRGAAWLKLKPSHTLDLVVLAAEWGSGRRQGFLSNIHLGARDPADQTFVMLGKTFKGMTDEMLAWQTREFQRLAVGEEGRVVHLRPELVVEVAFDGVQASQQYPGGMALRFARVRRYRPDKQAADADTVNALQSIAQKERPGAELGAVPDPQGG
jgi:DNA ligase 1